jgi:hypothetical protein
MVVAQRTKVGGNLFPLHPTTYAVYATLPHPAPVIPTYTRLFSVNLTTTPEAPILDTYDSSDSYHLRPHVYLARSSTTGQSFA